MSTEVGVSRDTLERLIHAGRLKRYRRFGDRKTYVDLDEAKQVLDWREE
jgi:excisionase family DNA binding protein